MKKLTLLTAIFLFGFTFSQVAIGKSSISKLPDGITNNPGVSLEFYDSTDNAKGIVLPWVSTVKDNPIAYNSVTGAGYPGMSTPIEDGTFILDLSDKKIKYMKNGNWVDLTGSPTFPLVIKDASNNDVTINSFSVDSSLQDSKKESTNAKVAIGVNAKIDNTKGMLVLTENDKAMVLPKVTSPHLTIINPSPGMIAYDTVKKQLAVFNGSVWSFWKP